MSDNLIFPESGQVLTIYSPLVVTAPSGSSGGISFQSGATLFEPGAVSGSATPTTVGQPAIAFGIGGNSTASGLFPVGMSGGGQANIAVLGSGFGNTVFASNSGTFAPAGYFFIQVPTSGTPVVKVPFFNS